MDMAEFNASFNNQWPLDWFKIQVDTIGPRESTMMQQMCHVKGGGTITHSHRILPSVT
jgi:hypothetical protein